MISTPKPLNVGCKNRRPYADEFIMKPRTHADGSISGKIIKNPMKKSCMVDVRMTEPGCQGCWWQTNMDPRDDPTAAHPRLDAQGRVQSLNA